MIPTRAEAVAPSRKSVVSATDVLYVLLVFCVVNDRNSVVSIANELYILVLCVKVR